MRQERRRLQERLLDILEAIKNVRDDVAGFDQAAFLADGKTQRAVIEGIIVIGEASRRIMVLAPLIETRYSMIWQQLRDAYDMRIILTHEYFRVDASIVWTTIHTSLNALESAVDTLLRDNELMGS